MTLRCTLRQLPAVPFLFAAALVSCWAPQICAQAVESSGANIAGVRLGIANVYKVGHWTPVRVEIADGQPLRDPHVEVIVEDGDGVATRATAPLSSPGTAGDSRSALVYTKVGRVGAPLRVRLMDGDALVDERLIENLRNQAAAETVGLPATGELVVALSAAAFGLKEALPDRGDADSPFRRRTVQLTGVDDLPTEWFGYEAVDAMLISAGDGAIVGELAADERRFAALVRWVQLGGKLVVLCGGESAETLLAKNGPLASLAPGQLADMVRLTETGPLEHFAEPAGPVAMTSRNAALEIPRLQNVDGRIVAYAGRRPSDLPIVVRSARGFGEITFAGVDLTIGPLAEWNDRGRFLQALVEPYVAPIKEDNASQTITTLGYNDLSGALRQRLGLSFQGVVPLGFSVVAGLAIAYLLTLGPINYLLVHRWLRKPMAGWITLPLIVVVFGFSALAVGQWRAGAGGVRVNQLALVDIDAASGTARGTMWSAFYSADARQFDLTASVKVPGQKTAVPPVLFSWWGLPGVGIGGMQGGGATLGIVDETYEYVHARRGLIDVPVLPSSTKSFIVRWTAMVGETLAADLADVDGYATGSIENRTGRTLRNARLLFGGWGYRLGNIADGQRIEVGEQLDARRVKTIVVGSALSTSGTLTDAERSVFMPEEANVLQLLNVMMFYQVAGGADFARLPSEYESYLDLSRHLDLGRAVLMAETDGDVSSLVDGVTGEAFGQDTDSSLVVMRWVLPVRQAEDGE